MKIHELTQIFGPVIESAAKEIIPEISLRPLFQPTMQPAGDMGVYYTILDEHRYGTAQSFKGNDVKISPDGKKKFIDKGEIQVVETLIQFSFRYHPDPAKSIITAKDIADHAAMKFASRTNLLNMRTKQVSILKIPTVKNPSFENQSDQFEFMPSFDVVFITNRSIKDQVPIIESFFGYVYSV